MSSTVLPVVPTAADVSTRGVVEREKPRLIGASLGTRRSILEARQRTSSRAEKV
jgi:hypothetical protein